MATKLKMYVVKFCDREDLKILATGMEIKEGMAGFHKNQAAVAYIKDWQMILVEDQVVTSDKQITLDDVVRRDDKM